MSRSFLISVVIHIALISLLLFAFEKKTKSSSLANSQKITLQYVVLKKESLAKQKQEKKELPRKEEKLQKQEPLEPPAALLSKLNHKQPKEAKNFIRAKHTQENKRVVQKTLQKKKITTKHLKKTASKAKKYTKKKQSTKHKGKKRLKKKQKQLAKRAAKSTTRASKRQKASAAKLQGAYFSLNKNLIYEAIQRAKHYPRVAKKLRIQGVVELHFRLNPNGTVSQLYASNAHPILLKAAKKTILKASREFPKPSSSVQITLKIAYYLR